MIATAWAALPALALGLVLHFCRIGTCLMLMPGFANARIPMQMRLLIALGVTVALMPALLGPQPQPVPAGAPLTGLFTAFFPELATGAVIGLMGRSFIAAFEFLGEAASNAIGLGTAGTVVDEEGALPSLVSLLTLTVTLLLFSTDQHWEVLRALAESYTVMPLGHAFNVETQLSDFAHLLEQASLLALQVCSPFVVYGVIVNFVFGLLNKIAPQIPAYYISIPFVIAGGFLLLYLTGGDSIEMFASGFSALIASGRL